MGSRPDDLDCSFQGVLVYDLGGYIRNYPFTHRLPVRLEDGGLTKGDTCNDCSGVVTPAALAFVRT